MNSFIESVAGTRSDKKRWKQYRARVAALPGGHRTAAEGFEHYLMRAGSQGYDAPVQMWEDLVDLFEQAAADGTGIRRLIGEDPVDFADAFSSNYGTKDWRAREKARLTECIARAEAEQR